MSHRHRKGGEKGRPPPARGIFRRHPPFALPHHFKPKKRRYLLVLLHINKWEKRVEEGLNLVVRYKCVRT